MKFLNGITVKGKTSFSVKPTVNEDGVVLESELSDFYTKSDIDEIVAKIESGESNQFYTKDEVDEKVTTLSEGITTNADAIKAIQEAGYITADALEDYYTKSETYSQTEIDEKLSAIVAGEEADLANYYTKEAANELFATIETTTALQTLITETEASLESTIETTKTDLESEIESSISDLGDTISETYATKEEVKDTTDELSDRIDTVEEEIKSLDLGVKYKVVDSKEEMTDEGYIYLLPKESGEGYTEWIVIDKDGTKVAEEIGDTDIDLTDYYTKEEVDSAIDTVSDAVEAEATAREEADTTLQDNIDTLSEKIDTATSSYEETNPTIVASNEEFTWEVEHGLNKKRVSVTLYEEATGEEVSADVALVDENNLTVTMYAGDEASLTAGTYAIVVK